MKFWTPSGIDDFLYLFYVHNPTASVLYDYCTYVKIERNMNNILL